MVVWRGFSFYSYIVIGFVFATLKKKADHKREQQMQLTETADGFIAGNAASQNDDGVETVDDGGQNEQT